METVIAECSSELAAFPEEAPTEQQINTPTICSESNESSNLQSESIYIHEEVSNDLDAEGGNSKSDTIEQLNNVIRILTNKVKLLQSKLSEQRKDKKKITRKKRRLGKNCCTIIYTCMLIVHHHSWL